MFPPQLFLELVLDLARLLDPATGFLLELFDWLLLVLFLEPLNLMDKLFLHLAEVEEVYLFFFPFAGLLETEDLEGFPKDSWISTSRWSS